MLPASFATGTLLIPFGGSQPRTQLGLSQLPSGLGALVGGGPSASERLIGVVLGSRSLADSLVARVARNREQEIEVRRILRKDLRVQRNPDGSINIETRSTDPQLATVVANTFPPLVNGILARVGAEGAMRKQAFLRQQLDTARERLTASQDRLLEFQRKREAPDPSEQARRTIDVAAQLQGSIYQQELVIEQLRRTSTPENPQLRAAEDELAARRAQLRSLTAGRSDNPVFVGFGAGPELKAASTRLIQDYTQEEGIYQALTAAMAEAQIDANNNLPVLSVLDSALVPTEPARSLPKTFVLSALLGAILGIGAVVFGEAAARLRADARNASFFDAWDDITASVRRRRVRSVAAAGD